MGCDRKITPGDRTVGGGKCGECGGSGRDVEIAMICENAGAEEDG